MIGYIFEYNGKPAIAEVRYANGAVTDDEVGEVSVLTTVQYKDASNNISSLGRTSRTVFNNGLYDDGSWLLWCATDSISRSLMERGVTEVYPFL